MKKLLLSFAFLLTLYFPLDAQWTSAHPGMEYRSKGTGRTTGHVIDLWLINTTDQEMKIDLPAFFIPTDGAIQGYVIPLPEDPTIMVDPGATVRIPLKGYCTDIHKPPVGDGESTIPVKEWLTPIDVGDGPNPGDFIDETVFKPNKEIWPQDSLNPTSEGEGSSVKKTITYPGTEIPFPYTTDFKEHAKEVAPLIFEAIDLITTAFDSLYENGDIITPFSSNPGRERDAVIQQSFWMYTSYLEDKPYTFLDFENKMQEQFEDATGKKITETDSLTTVNFTEGVDQFWDTFELVGTEAKVLLADENEAVEEMEEEQVFIDENLDTNERDCSCDHCTITREASILKYKNTGGNERYTSVNEDTITWNYNMKYTPPEVVSNCPEEGCEIKVVTAYKSVFDKDDGGEDISTWTEGEQIREALSSTGVLIYTAHIEIYCDDKLCCEKLLSDTLYIVESNDCCEQIRKQNNGQLIFSFGDGKSLKMDQNSLTLNKDGQRKRFNFPINIEAEFCNLRNGQIISDIHTQMQSEVTGGELNESDSSSSLSMERANETDLLAQGIEPHYTFRYSLTENGEETQFAFSMDKASCKYDLSVLYDDELDEFTSGSIYSYFQLQNQIRLLGSHPQSRHWWQRMQFLMLQVVKMESAESNRAWRLIKQKLLSAISLMLNDETEGGWNLLSDQEEQLLRDIRSALNRGDRVEAILLLNSGNLPY
jgi:hypothetical protein